MFVLGGMLGLDAMDIEVIKMMTGYESDQAKIFNRSVKELILTRSKFQSANSVQTYKQTNGKWPREKYKAKNFRTW